jgi:uncharacterized Zn-binding protein involved in type VI secretion
VPAAARVGDQTNHGGVVSGPGVPNVFIGGKPASVAGDTHICAIPQPHPPSVFARGSGSVYISGRPVLRQGDVAGCGGEIVSGAFQVLIGG